MKEIYVIWPSSGAASTRGVESLQATIKELSAKGYVGNPNRVIGCEYMILSSGNDAPKEHYIAKIDSVTRNNRLDTKEKKYACVDVMFSNPKPINSHFLDKLKWGSRNVKFIKLNDDLYEAINQSPRISIK